MVPNKKELDVRFDLKEFSIEEIYASWIRNVLIIVGSTLAIFSIMDDYNSSSKKYQTIVIIWAIIICFIICVRLTK